MERELRIFEMEETTNPVVLACSRLIHDRFPPEYAAMRARRAINLKAVKNSNDDLWSFVMIPDGPLVSGLFPLFLYSSARCRRDSDVSFFLAESGRERSAVRPAHAPSPSARALQRREQERAERKNERGISRRKRREQRDKEFRLRGQQGLPPPPRHLRIRRREMKKRRRERGAGPR
jgi:hypothetical protein